MPAVVLACKNWSKECSRHANTNASILCALCKSKRNIVLIIANKTWRSQQLHDLYAASSVLLLNPRKVQLFALQAPPRETEYNNEHYCVHMQATEVTAGQSNFKSPTQNTKKWQQWFRCFFSAFYYLLSQMLLLGYLDHAVQVFPQIYVTCAFFKSYFPHLLFSNFHHVFHNHLLYRHLVQMHMESRQKVQFGCYVHTQ